MITPFFTQFVRLCASQRIDVPIEAGIMPIVSKKQLDKIVSLCGAIISDRLNRTIQRYRHSLSCLRNAGIEYAAEHILNLIDSGNVEFVFLR